MSSLQYDPLPFECSGLKLFVPDPDQVRYAYEKGSINDFPYWSRIWPSSIALSHYINENRHLIEGKKVCEVGAGLGLPAFMAAKYASSVMITDHDHDALEWINYNILELEAEHVSCSYLDWRERSFPKADIILMSDIGYNKDDFADVHHMIRSYLSSSAIILLAIPARIISGKFMAPFEGYLSETKMMIIADTEVLCVILSVAVGTT